MGKIEMGVMLITTAVKSNTPSSILPRQSWTKYDYGVLHPTR
jgi:hypothetical protein